MLKLLIRIFAKYLLLLMAASLVIFLCLEVLPGDVVQMMMGPDADPQAVAMLREQLGFNQPAWVRYLDWVGNFLHFDWGQSYVYKTSVFDLISQRLVVTIPLAFGSLFIALIIANYLAFTACLHHNKWQDKLLMSIAQIGIAIPSFWLAMLLIVIFAVKLHWLPSGGFIGWKNSFWLSLQALILPTIALSLSLTSVLARHLRRHLLDAQNEGFVQTARAKGFTEKYILKKHILAHTFAPTLTIIGLQFAGLLAGAIVIEQVFSLPGIGKLLINSISNRDLTVLRSCLLLLVSLTLLVNFITNYLHELFDPRLLNSNHP